MAYFILLITPFVIVATAYFLVDSIPDRRTLEGTVPFVTSALPWFGNIFEFRRHPVLFFKICRKTYGPVYRLLLAGRKTTVISHQKGIALLNRDLTRSFTSKPLYRRILETGIGVRTNQDYLLDYMQAELHPLLIKSLSPTSMVPVADIIQESLMTDLRATGPSICTTVVVQLDTLVSQPLYRAGCLAFFGPTFPFDTFDDFHLFACKFPLLITGLPFVANDAIIARRRIITAFEAYIAPFWAGEAIEGISDVITSSMQEMLESATKHEAACLLTLFTFGFYTNTSNMVFWLLAHVIHQNLAATLRQELYEAQTTGAGTPMMDSAINEALRWSTTNTTVRVATKDTSILVDEKLVAIREGELVVADVQSLNHDPAVYSNPDDFVFNRFVASGSGFRSPKPFSFGGGSHLCPGRHLAKFEMKCFMETLLQMYEIKAVTTAGGKLRLPVIDKRDVAGTLRSSENFLVELSHLDK